MKYLLKLLISIVLITVVYPQNYKQRFYKKNFKSSFATEKRQIRTRNDLDKKIDNLLTINNLKKNPKELRSIFKELKLKLIRKPVVKKIITKVLSEYSEFSEKLIYEIIELAYILYPKEFTEPISKINASAKTPDLFVISSKYLILNKIRKDYLTESKKRFRKKNVLLKGFEKELSGSEKIPSLKDLLKHSFMKNKTVIFSIHRKNRKFPGLTIVRNPDGEFVKNEKNEIICVRQLANSVTNLPGYMRRGNTPQGIYSVQGYYITKTESIGPSPIVISRLPFEAGVSVFFHGRKAGKWNLEKYKSLLPESWKNYYPFTESYRAGKLGRRLIIMHGSADDLSYLKELPYYPLTPSLGCLTTIELWDKTSGALIESDQLKLMNAFYNSGKLNGFLVVVEIDNQQKSVEPDEIKRILMQ